MSINKKFSYNESQKTPTLYNSNESSISPINEEYIKQNDLDICLTNIIKASETQHTEVLKKINDINNYEEKKYNTLIKMIDGIKISIDLLNNKLSQYDIDDDAQDDSDAQDDVKDDSDDQDDVKDDSDDQNVSDHQNV